MRTVLNTEIPGAELFSRGKVRDNWLLPKQPDLLLMVTTDRISAFDVVMRQGVPDLGKIRNQISLSWFKRLQNTCRNHAVSSDPEVLSATLGQECLEANDLSGRAVLVRRAQVFPVECVVRGYLYGSAWEEYQDTGTVCGIHLRPGLKQAERLAKPIFTPATKAKIGHDENIDFDAMVQIVGFEVAEELLKKSIRLYEQAAWWAHVCGVIIADTKFEFGLYEGEIMLVDEVLTPDSSRFWDMEAYVSGQPQSPLDKQLLRDWLKATGWNKKPPPPDLPESLIAGIREKYIKAYEILIGNHWPPSF